MSSFSGVVATAEFDGDLLVRLASISVRPTGSAATKRLLVDVPTSRPEVLEGFAQHVAQTTGASAFTLLGQTSVDVYVVAEVTASSVVRRLEYSRDANPQWALAGSPQPWEADLHFAVPIDELVEELLEWDWSEAEVEAVRAAHASTRMARLPPVLRRSFVKFTESLGVDLEHPSATWKPPGFWARLLGRA